MTTNYSLGFNHRRILTIEELERSCPLHVQGHTTFCLSLEGPDAIEGAVKSSKLRLVQPKAYSAF